MGDDKRGIDGREFVSLITSNQRRIYSYILTLVPNLSDSDDILQETTALMWERKCDFKSGTDFAAWGARIAYFKILDHRKKVNKNRQLIADKQFSRFAEEALEQSEHVNTMIQKLEECVKKLPESDRLLIHMRYSIGFSAKKISTRVNKSIRSVYLGISRIQGLLLRCIERTAA